MKKRNEGIDLLRCLAMLMVVVLHVLNHGGILESSARGMPVYNAAWLLRAAGTCAVNCYALISGYVGV
ncbi:MAG: acyltransferase family protein [Clostridia bacterium]|nr:acyltransferase family protein [Clostridia bacterium]